MTHDPPEKVRIIILFGVQNLDVLPLFSIADISTRVRRLRTAYVLVYSQKCRGKAMYLCITPSNSYVGATSMHCVRTVVDVSGAINSSNAVIIDFS